MKQSNYNNIVHVNEEMCVLYNSLNSVYLLLKKGIAEYLENNDLDGLHKVHHETWDELVKKNVIIDNNIDELSLVDNIRLRRRYSSLEYHLIINPTLDCNLGCWYCYESHRPTDYMKEAMVEQIIKHLECHYKETKFQALLLDLFGGEPLLRKNLIYKILDKVKDFCKQKKIKLNLNITTNGTLLNKEFLNAIKDTNVLFQITLDGDRSKHDTVRFFKKTSKGSYDVIIEHLKLLTQILENYKLIVRINFDGKTLSNLKKILDDIEMLPREKISLGLHRVWQIEDKTIDYKLLYNFIHEANRRKFIVDFMPLNGLITHVCYADNYNQSVINFDGNVFKCTARDFTPNNREGFLDDNGQIVWDVSKIRKRLSTRAQDKCVRCKLYPACVGNCSQNLMEQNGNVACHVESSIGIDNLILINFNQALLREKIFGKDKII